MANLPDTVDAGGLLSVLGRTNAVRDHLHEKQYIVDHFPRGGMDDSEFGALSDDATDLFFRYLTHRGRANADCAKLGLQNKVETRVGKALTDNWLMAVHQR